MRKLSTLVFLLLILIYLGAHASCYHREVNNLPSAVVEQMTEHG